jgi:hypothetical protein
MLENDGYHDRELTLRQEGFKGGVKGQGEQCVFLGGPPIACRFDCRRATNHGANHAGS